MSLLPLQSSRRTNFRGRTNPYLNLRDEVTVQGHNLLATALENSEPGDATGVSFNETFRDSVRERNLTYSALFNFYDGKQWVNPYADGEIKPVFNFTHTIIQKATDWLEGKGWSIASSEGNEGVVDFLNKTWRVNRRASLSLRAANNGAVKGDSYFYVTLRTKDAYGRDLPKEKYSVRIQSVSPEHVVPVWSDTEEGRMKACLIQYPIRSALGKVQLYTIWITPEWITTYIDEIVQEKIKNPIGEVTVVHCPNLPRTDSPFGESDILHVVPLNIAYNTAAFAMQETLRYHAEPTTIIYGAKASQLEKGARSVWSGLPENARVENLELQGDLAASREYLIHLFNQICQISHTPKVAFDSFDVRVTSSSAAAFEMMFTPLAEKTRRRQSLHAEAIREVNRLVLLIKSKIIKTGDKEDDFESLSDDLESLMEDTDVAYTSPLPRDEAVFLDLGVKRVNAGVWSNAELVRQCSGVTNMPRLVIELLADKRALLIAELEKAKALSGERPSSASVFLDSLALTEDLKALQAEIAALDAIVKGKSDK